MRRRFTVERLRVWLLLGAGLLVVVIAAFLGYAHYRAHKFLKDLPRKLGAEITQETDAFTYSQSVQGKTVYTIHAAKAIQHKDGKITLREVTMVLYGRKADRLDRISGSEFEYDKSAGVIRAMGEVHIDLQAPGAAPVPGAGKGDANVKRDFDDADEGPGSKLIHVKTSGLVFMEKLGEAATTQPIEFSAGGMTGRAVGAEYNSDVGVLVLESAVKLSMVRDGKPLDVEAARAELDREGNQAVLTRVRYLTAQQQGSAERAVVHLRSDGTAEKLEASGNVVLTRAGGGKVSAPRVDVMLNAASQPQDAMVTGGVQYVLDESTRQAQGSAGGMHMVFDGSGRARTAALQKNVKAHERELNKTSGQWEERELTAESVDAVFGDEGKKTVLKSATANGGARIVTIGASGVSKKTKGTQTTLIAADVLKTDMVGGTGGPQISHLHGVGNTRVESKGADGSLQTSTGDALDVTFGIEKRGGMELQSAVQTGHVVVLQTAPTMGTKGATSSHASADRGEYDAAQDQLVLTGDTMFADEQMVMRANRLVVNREGGTATADGSVRGTYVQSGAGDPVHVVAERAEMQRETKTAVFHGGKAAARLWLGGSQVMAPTIEFSQKEQRLTAHGDSSGLVRTVLASKDAAATNGKAAKNGGVLRVTSHDLVYVDGERRADFTGNVAAANSTGTFKSARAVVFLEPIAVAKTSKAKVTFGSDQLLSGSVQRVIADGGVRFDQPGRTATGEQMVYTAYDGKFELTGTPETPPKVVDAEQGTVTGASLIFHAGDDSVVVSSGTTGAGGQRVRTETKVKK